MEQLHAHEVLFMMEGNSYNWQNQKYNFLKRNV